MLWRSSKGHPSCQSTLVQPVCPTVPRITFTILSLLLTAFHCSIKWALTTYLCRTLQGFPGG